jgi:hypothetical protein
MRRSARARLFVRVVWRLVPLLLVACSYDPAYPPGVSPQLADAAVHPSFDMVERVALLDGATADTLPINGIDASVAAADRTPDVGADVPAVSPAADMSPLSPAPDTRSPDLSPDAVSTPPPCTPQTPTIFNATPAGTCGSVCNIDRARVPDGMFAGLECTGGGFVLIDGESVTACIGGDFGAVMDLDPLFIRIASTDNACGTPCTTRCETGRTALVFHGEERGSLRFAAKIAVEPTAQDFRITLGRRSRFVVVCRSGSGAHRDDISVDSIVSRAACE